MSGGIGLLVPEKSREQILMESLGYKGWTGSLQLASAQASLTNQRLQAAAIGLKAGDVVTNIHVATNAASTSCTLAKLGIYSYLATPARLAVTSSIHTDFNTAGSKIQTGALTSAYTVPTTGAYYFVVLVDGGTPATIIQNANGVIANGGVVLGSNPRQNFQQSALADLPATCTPADANAHPWFGWS